jgi:hypothetical protein
MDQFSLWSGIAHSLVSKHTPKIKLGQVHQLLAACLGHRTYASLRVADLEILNQKPHYVLFDEGAALARAADLGLSLTEAQWREVTMALRPSGVTPFWLTTMASMDSAARITFEDSSDSRIHSMKREVGFPDGHRGLSTRCHSKEDEMPDFLRFDVHGEVCAYNEETWLAIPVIAVVEFPKVGRRMYGDGTLVSVERRGEPRTRDLDEDEYDGEVYWMSED